MRCGLRQCGCHLAHARGPERADRQGLLPRCRIPNLEPIVPDCIASGRQDQRRKPVATGLAHQNDSVAIAGGRHRTGQSAPDRGRPATTLGQRLELAERHRPTLPADRGNQTRQDAQADLGRLPEQPRPADLGETKWADAQLFTSSVDDGTGCGVEGVTRARQPSRRLRQGPRRQPDPFERSARRQKLFGAFATAWNVPVGLLTLTAIVERIEVLKAGASSIYGSDAVAGVVNIITDAQTRGLTIDAQVNVPEVGAGVDKRISATFGFDSDRLNVIGSVEYRKRDALRLNDRGFTKCPIGGFLTGEGTPFGSGDGVGFDGTSCFTLDNGGGKRTQYQRGQASLEGLVLFTNSSPGNSDAAFVKEFTELHAYYKNTRLLQLVVRDGKAHGWGGMEKDLEIFADWFDEHLRGIKPALHQ